MKNITRWKSKIFPANTKILFTVQDLVNYSGLSRATFYRNYIDKEDFLEKLMNDLIDGLLPLLKGLLPNIRTNWRAIFPYPL